MSEQTDILFERRGELGQVTLNRPAALNALTLDMAIALDRQLHAWEADPKVKAVLIQGAGERAFCAGGDVRRLFEAGRAGERYPYDFYRHEYRLNARIHRFPKPYVALMDGIVMGGGVGLSVHGGFRVAGERTLFAMPETGIGLFPDVGGSYFLSRLPDALGMFLALTGTRLKAADAVAAGVCDFHVPGERRPTLLAALAAADLGGNARAKVDALLRPFAADPGPAPLAPHRAVIAQSFDKDSVEAILAALDGMGGEWAQATAKTLRARSPTSLKITHRQIREGARLDFQGCMRMEYRMAAACTVGHDFYEGVRATVIDKDNAPRWHPASLSEVGPEVVARHFEVPPPGGDLTFPEQPAE
ncbi:MAG: enoyl-CoA hydratase/isomerase family protein [Alphaproteobacteria bacterium]|nr:enoyl-CoA hydratase/isomerase family protein [Alphaproteobacteria bacterium]